MATQMIECFDGFSWAVPMAFKDAIAQCRFEQGDTLYDTRDGYQVWEDALKSITYSVTVLYPPATVRSPLARQDTGLPDSEVDTDAENAPAHSLQQPPEQSTSLFKQNWYSKVELKLYDYRQSSKNFIMTTQGRLFTLLWKGQIETLSAANEPRIPILVDEVQKALRQAGPSLKARFSNTFAKTNLFAMAYDPANQVSRLKRSAIQSCLTANFGAQCVSISPADAAIKDCEFVSPTISIMCFGIDSAAPEKIRDALKELLYKPSKQKENSDIDRFKLERHGLFIPSVERHFGDFVTHSFAHSERNFFYRYRLAVKRLDNCPSELKEYLNEMLTNCPNHFFREPPYASEVRLPFHVKASVNRFLPIVDIARDSLNHQTMKSVHENVEKYFIQNDPYSLASEVPVWLEPGELQDYAALFGCEDVLTGHIDLLRYEPDGKIWVWDFKPNAFKETSAAVQVFLYAVMLSIRTGLSLNAFRCGYFDTGDAYYFDPSAVAEANNIKAPDG